MTESECISSLFSPNNKGRRGNACELAEETPSREAVDGPLSAYSISEEDENSGRPAALLAPLGGVSPAELLTRSLASPSSVLVTAN